MKLLILWFTFPFILPVHSQITVGQTVPDMSFGKVFNYEKNANRLYDLKGKLVILDFMSTGCLSCIESLPKFDSLQKQYYDQLQIFIVTPDKEERIRNFLTKSKFGKGVQLPIIAEDSSFAKLFPHQYISHIVWIGKDETVKAITKKEYVKKQNIQMLLDDKKVNWPIKRDVTDYDNSHPLFTLDENNIPFFSFPTKDYYSVFTSYMPGIPRVRTYNSKTKSEYIPDSVNQTERIAFINFPILFLYLKACNQKLNFPQSRMIFEIRDTQRLVYNKEAAYKTVWDQNNTYCYEAVFPVNISIWKRNEKICSDLNLYLNMNGRMETRKVKCLVLVRNGGSDALLKKTLRKVSKVEKEDENIARQISISDVVFSLNHTLYNPPVFDETGYKDKQYLELSLKQLSDIELAKVVLERYGLKFKEEEREVEMFVLTENGYNLNK
jgi:thiol-disulfide isomerase/thioredoxin